jgi:hypothetical protein
VPIPSLTSEAFEKSLAIRRKEEKGKWNFHSIMKFTVEIIKKKIKFNLDHHGTM